MSNTRVIKTSFAGGEMSPEMAGRIDDTKYQSGASKIQNMIVMPQGPVSNRPGFAFVREVKDSRKRTRLIPFTFNTTQTVVIEVGAGYFRFHSNGGTFMNGSVPYEIANPFAEYELFSIHYVQSADVLTLVHQNHAPIELRRYGATDWRLFTINFGSPLPAPTGITSTKYIPASQNVPTDTYVSISYVVTAVTQDGMGESSQSAITSISNNIYITGAYNTISWNAVQGASRYNIYKSVAGVFGFMGSTSGTYIVDDNIMADSSRTPPIYDNEFLSAGNYPGAVSYFEQRRCFAGTLNEPQKIWMTKSGTESNMSYGIPIRDDDRVEFRVAAREANTILHIVPVSDLMLLTGAAEWRVGSINTDAITPTSISVRPQSYVGASTVQPVIVNNAVIYCSSRGGHLRELGYNWQVNGFITSDLSIRASHLFDWDDIVDLAYAKAPTPIIWAVQSSGRLIGVTYVPDQQVNGIHWHETKGSFESCAVVSEGMEDILYVVVKRLINNKTVRYIERMHTRKFTDLKDCFFVDSGGTYNGNNISPNHAPIMISLSGGSKAGDKVTITALGDIFNYPSQTDAGDYIILDESVTIVIEKTLSKTVAEGTLRDDLLPSHTGYIAEWGIARDTISGLSHLEGEDVSVLSDGAVHPPAKVQNGSITLEQPGMIVHVGLGYNSVLETLPVSIQIDGFGQGRTKNVNHVFMRVFESSGIFAGPIGGDLIEFKQRTDEPYGSPPRPITGEIKITPKPKWTDGGQVSIVQKSPLPLTVVSMTLEIAIGG